MSLRNGQVISMQFIFVADISKWRASTDKSVQPNREDRRRHFTRDDKVRTNRDFRSLQVRYRQGESHFNMLCPFNWEFMFV